MVENLFRTWTLLQDKTTSPNHFGHGSYHKTVLDKNSRTLSYKIVHLPLEASRTSRRYQESPSKVRACWRLISSCGRSVYGPLGPPAGGTISDDTSCHTTSQKVRDWTSDTRYRPIRNSDGLENPPTRPYINSAYLGMGLEISHASSCFVFEVRRQDF